MSPNITISRSLFINLVLTVFIANADMFCVDFTTAVIQVQLLS